LHQLALLVTLVVRFTHRLYNDEQIRDLAAQLFCEVRWNAPAEPHHTLPFLFLRHLNIQLHHDDPPYWSRCGMYEVPTLYGIQEAWSIRSPASRYEEPHLHEQVGSNDVGMWDESLYGTS